jgi:hypothetical protein
VLEQMLAADERPRVQHSDGVWYGLVAISSWMKVTAAACQPKVIRRRDASTFRDGAR